MPSQLLFEMKSVSCVPLMIYRNISQYSYNKKYEPYKQNLAQSQDQLNLAIGMSACNVYLVLLSVSLQESVSEV